MSTASCHYQGQGQAQILAKYAHTHTHTLIHVAYIYACKYVFWISIQTVQLIQIQFQSKPANDVCQQANAAYE